MITITDINTLYLNIEKQIEVCKKNNDVNDIQILRARLVKLDTMLQRYIAQGGK